MRSIKRYANYLVLTALLVGMVGLFFVSISADRNIVLLDPNLESAVRDALDQPVKPLDSTRLSKISALDASGRGIVSLEGIEHLTNLTVLNLENNQVRDVSPLGSLKKLRELNLRSNGMYDLEAANFAALKKLPLQKLYLDYNVVIVESGERFWLSDVGVLGSFTRLRELTLTENKISDLSPFAGLTDLRTLSLEYNEVQDVSPLRQLTSLRTLNLGNNDVHDLSPLAGLAQLKHLFLHQNRNAGSLRPLARLTQLQTLTLDGMPVGGDISVLAEMHQLEIFSAVNGQITDISALKELLKLTRLYLSENDIVDLSPLSSLFALQDLKIQSNRNVSSILPIQHLTLLEELDLQDVPVGGEIYALANLTRLDSLDLRNSGISDVTVLGELMAGGTLQDNPFTSKPAAVDLRDNPISVTGLDAYRPIRDYWANISQRDPFLLPEYTPLAPPVFSAEGGFYTRPFELTLATGLENAQIFYTLDGSIPSRESLQYSAPIAVRSRAGETNVFSEIPDVSPRWIPPAGEVFKASVVRARVIDTAGNTSPVVTHTYLVDEEKRYSFPVLSLVTDPFNLFDPKYGIYVMGEIYDQFYDPNSQISPWERPANYNQRGQAWERPIHVEFFLEDGAVGFSQEASVRIQGAATRERAQKSLRIYSDCNNNCPEAFDYELFPGLTGTGTGAPITEYHTFLLRNSGNDWELTMFRDALLQSLIEHTGLDTQAYRPAVVFLNGEYWGIHNLRERLDEYYVAHHYGIDSQDVVILTENSQLTSGNPGDEQHYLDMLEYMETHDLSDPDHYAYIQTQMDVDNFIDYQVAEIFFDNMNWPHVNIKYWRKKTAAFEPDAPYGLDGRWRWMVFDTDFAFGFEGGTMSADHNNFTNAIQPNWNNWAGLVLRSLLANPEFERSFINRFADHLNSSFVPRRVVEKIDQMEAMLAPEMAEHIRRWQGADATVDEWESRVNVMRGYAEARPQFVRQQIIDTFGLDGYARLRLTTDSDKGYIRINSLDIREGTPGVQDPGVWDGVYFLGIPVEITAIAYPGYRFEGWEGLDMVSNEERLSILLTEDMTISAVFAGE